MTSTLSSDVEASSAGSPRLISGSVPGGSNFEESKAAYIGTPKWAAARARQDAERDRVIKSSLDKLKLNPIAQYMIGVTELHRYIPDSSEPQN